MKNLNITGLVILFLFLLWGCEEEKVDVINYGSLSGVVLDGTTYQPIDGVLIATNPASSSVITSGAGEFTFSKVLSGDVSVTARKKDYLSSTVVVSVYNGEKTQMNMILLKDDNDYGSVTIYDPVPGNGAVNQQRSFNMGWKVDQSKYGISLMYDVYLFKSNSSTQTVVGESLNVKEVVVDNLEDNTTYYWYVVAKYEGNIVANSPTWSFKTGDNSN
ncbi:carboxypeptidase-like regulatory domain-containing protein [Sunxiuqinia indica]|uniref:carboxypeptidase-like regulatory domain-containing protein n=1 Tax=Sunxiuqinia indica TaxID=2692584 RepID=UPI00135B5433|nr:carboxypeptidase-like regulatory domain-containing protein [Sunxiuqinia indica]